jgi:SAM-dependent methyltransferase
MARTRTAAQQLTNVTYVHADAQIHPFAEASFDVAISMTGGMFFADQRAAFANIARALRPNGRLAMVSWQGAELNEWFMAFVDALTLGAGLAPPPPGAPSPFLHADPARTEPILTDAGFAGLRAESLELPMYFGATADEAYAVLSKMLAWMTGDATPAERTESLERLRSTLTAHQTPAGVAYQSRAWLYTARRS